MTNEERKELERRIAVMQAYLDGGSVECIRTDRSDNWTEMPSPRWDWASCNYRIAEPVKKKIKLEAWITTRGELLLLTADQIEYLNIRKYGIRLPDLDQETEVME